MWDNTDEENLLQDNLIESKHRRKCDKCDKYVRINICGKKIIYINSFFSCPW